MKPLPSIVARDSHDLGPQRQAALRGHWQSNPRGLGFTPDRIAPVAQQTQSSHLHSQGRVCRHFAIAMSDTGSHCYALFADYQGNNFHVLSFITILHVLIFKLFTVYFIDNLLYLKENIICNNSLLSLKTVSIHIIIERLV